MPVNRKQVDTSDSERTRLAERLRLAREYLTLSQDEVAKAVGIPRAAISLIESGQRRVDVLELKKFAVVYDRPISYFTGEEQNSRMPEEVEHLARAVKKLSSKDREELTRFAEFLQSKAAKER
jgi:transcriptional regulator with XRE-family HTH domain